jgi:AraC family transcriptional regulator, regulatory protein of adaptative response / methylated-DNA-[protein]-cysteine methyltransferase
MINENNYKKIEKSLKYMIENFRINPTTQELAKNVSLSKFHYLRIFKEYT